MTDIRDPRLIIQKIKEQKKIESNLSHNTVRFKLYQTEMKNKESPADFINKFENSIKDVENCEGAIPLTEDEKRFIFFKAIKSAFPQIVTTDFIYTQTNGKEMSLDQLKRYAANCTGSKLSQCSAIIFLMRMSHRIRKYQLRKNL